MRLFQAPLDTCLDSPFFAGLSVHGLHFTVYALSTCVDSEGSWKASMGVSMYRVYRNALLVGELMRVS